MSKVTRFISLIGMVILTFSIPIAVGTVHHNKKPVETYWRKPLIRKQAPAVPYEIPSGVIKDGGFAVALSTYTVFYNKYRRIRMSHKRAKEEAIIQVLLRGRDSSLISEKVQVAVRETYEAGLILCK